MIKTQNPMDEAELARLIYAGYENALARGHTDYMRRAKWLEGMYIGNGQQWSAEDQAAASLGGFPLLELNMIQPTINAIASFQLNNRVDPMLVPSGGQATTELAEVLSRVLKEISVSNDYPRTETSVFMDALTQQRGYAKISLDFTESITGRIKITNPDPLDIIPDADAKSQNPDQWGRVYETGWNTLDQIEIDFGSDKRAAIELMGYSDPDWGDDTGELRNKFGMSQNQMYSYNSAAADKSGLRRIRTLSCQQWHYEKTKVAIFHHDDVRNIEGATDEKIAEFIAQGAIISTRPMRKVRWTVIAYGKAGSDQSVMLHDDWSPLPFFSIVPCFCVFRRGQTSGVVDLAAGMQETYNKLATQYMRIVNGVAGTGWVAEEGSLVNMNEEELAIHGSGPSTVIVYKKGATKPERMQPINTPNGLLEMMNEMGRQLKDNTLSEAARGLVDGKELSGRAINAKQFASQHQIALPLDGLACFRRMLWERVLKIVQLYWTHSRMLRYTETDGYGNKTDVQIPLNTYDDDCNLINDLSAGTYLVTLVDTPQANTTDNQAFDQLVQIAQLAPGSVPPKFLMRASTYPDKEEAAKAMEEAAGAQSPAPVDPTLQAKADLLAAQAEGVRAGIALTQARADQAKAASVETNVRAIYGATEAAQVISLDPATSKLSDQLLGSAGFVDHDAPPIVGEINKEPISSALATSGAPRNPMLDLGRPAGFPAQTDPISPSIPPSPFDGVNKGIETPQNDG